MSQDLSIRRAFPALDTLAPEANAEAEAALNFRFEPTDRTSLWMTIALFGTIASDDTTPVDGLVAAAEQVLAALPDLVEADSFAYRAIMFCVGVFTAEMLQDRGEPVGPASFLNWAMLTTNDNGRLVEVARFRLWEPINDGLDLLLLETSLRFMAVFFAHAWQRPDYDDLADRLWDHGDHLFDAALGLTEAQLAGAGLDRDATLFWMVPAAMLRIQWAIRAQRRDPRDEFSGWERLIDNPEVSTPIRKMLLSLPAFSDVQLTDRAQSAYARRLLDDYPDDLSAPVELRALCSSCEGSRAKLVETLPAIIAAAERHRQFDYEHEGVVERSYSRSQAAVAVSWALRILVGGRHFQSACELLRAWLPSEPDGPAPAYPLFMEPTSVLGTRWSCDAGIWPASDDDQSETLAQFSETVNRAFGLDLEIADDLRYAGSERVGIPVESEADDYDQITHTHLRLDALTGVTDEISDDAVIIPWPMMQIPVQAQLNRSLGRTWPISASLCEPAPDRELRKIVVMGGGVYSSQMEREAIAQTFQRAGREVTSTEHATLDAFRASYEDPSVDSIWFCSHGTQDRTRPHLSGLNLDDGGFATLAQLQALNLPASDRQRLLVLNICDGGSPPMLNGSFSLGSAAVLARPTQAVISHMWPVNPIIAAAFAALLAGELAAGQSYRAAFGTALSALAEGSAPVAKRLRERELCDIADRVDNNALPWESIFSWGSPVMVV